MPAKREIQPSGYAEAIHRKNQAREKERSMLRSGQLNPRQAQVRSSLFQGLRSRVIRHGQSAAI